MCGLFPTLPPLLPLTLHLLADEKLGLGSPALPASQPWGGRGPPPTRPQTLAADPCRGAAGAFRALGCDGAPNTRDRRGGPSLWLEKGTLGGAQSQQVCLIHGFIWLRSQPLRGKFQAALASLSCGGRSSRKPAQHGERREGFQAPGPLLPPTGRACVSRGQLPVPASLPLCVALAG